MKSEHYRGLWGVTQHMRRAHIWLEVSIIEEIDDTGDERHGQLQLFAQLMTVSEKKKHKQTFRVPCSGRRLPASEPFPEIFDTSELIFVGST